MMSVEWMLNPSLDDVQCDGSLEHRDDERYLKRKNAGQNVTVSLSRPRPAKMQKDAPVFVRGPTRGPVNFPPYDEIDDGQLREDLVRWQVYPLGSIGSCPRHIPYSSEKKEFSEKTGRECFEAFQYTFKVPGEEKAYTVLWDYNNGLVKITSLFKSCKFSKTTPARMLGRNPGLKDLSYSITGGALVAQGYWIPFEAAEAVAATFCYQIRYALVPLFGPQFLERCLQPGDPGFNSMAINARIVEQCAAQARVQSFRASAEEHAVEPAEEVTKYRSIPNLRSMPAPKRGLQGFKFEYQRQEHCSESGYGTETDQTEESLSPLQRPTCACKKGFKGQWVPSDGTLDAEADTEGKGGSNVLCSSQTRAKKRSYSELESQQKDTLAGSNRCRGSSAPKTTGRSHSMSGQSESSSSNDMKAAYTLLQLNAADARLPLRKKTRVTSKVIGQAVL